MEQIPDKYRGRRLKHCPKCGGTRIRVVNGLEIGGLSDQIYYNACPGCGFIRAITFRQPKEKL